MKEHTALPHYSITYCCSSDIKSSGGNTITKVTYEEPIMYSITVNAFCHQPSQFKWLLSPLCHSPWWQMSPKERGRKKPRGALSESELGEHTACLLPFEHPQAQNLKANCSLGNTPWSWLTCPNHRTGTSQPSTRTFNSLGTFVSPFDDFLCNFL